MAAVTTAPAVVAAAAAACAGNSQQLSNALEAQTSTLSILPTLGSSSLGASKLGAENLGRLKAGAAGLAGSGAGSAASFGAAAGLPIIWSYCCNGATMGGRLGQQLRSGTAGRAGGASCPATLLMLCTVPQAPEHHSIKLLISHEMCSVQALSAPAIPAT